MKTHLLYIIIGVLLAGNAVLLLKKSPLPDALPGKNAQRDLPERVVLLDSLVLRQWSDNAVVQPDFRKPTFLFFFSRKNCSTCVDKVVDFLSGHAIPAVETYIISTDVHDAVEKEAYNARFLHALPFYGLHSVQRAPGLDLALPVLMVVNEKREILYARQVLPSDDLQGDYLFWKRMNFLYALLAL